MDIRTKSELLKFFDSNVEQVGDLATWIHNPQRRYHRHEFFGLDVASVTLAPSAAPSNHFRLRDLGYGGCAVVGEEVSAAELTKRTERFAGKLRVLDQVMTFAFESRHNHKSVVGCEFVEMTAEQLRFLQSFIQYMDAALQVRQVAPDGVFPSFRGKGWLNLAGHRDAIRFNMRFDPNAVFVEANLIYIVGGRHLYCSWNEGKPEVGVLEGAALTPDERKIITRQIVCILIGVRQGASLAGLGPLTHEVIALL
jgi:hypothetical protein